jgi:hypothetical protein
MGSVFTGGNGGNGEEKGFGFEHQEREASEGRQVGSDLCGTLRPSCKTGSEISKPISVGFVFSCKNNPWLDRRKISHSA